jgi:hypothetical protein
MLFKAEQLSFVIDRGEIISMFHYCPVPIDRKELMAEPSAYTHHYYLLGGATEGCNDS